MNKTLYMICAILTMAIVTYLPRVLPIAIFKKKVKSRFIRSFLYYIPYAVLSAMTFPFIFYSTDNLLTALVGTIVALCFAYFGKSLVVVAFFSFIAVLISQIFIK